MLDASLVVLNRNGRHASGDPAVIGAVDGAIAVMLDDIIDTGETLVSGARALRTAGAARVVAAATHAVFRDGAPQRLADSELERIVVTDTVTHPADALAANVEVISIAPLLADSIARVYADSIARVYAEESVSAIFGGMNELF